VPTLLVREYYAQRASAGLIVSEAACVTPAGVGYERMPGIWSLELVGGWRGVTAAVHDRGGRISEPSLLGGDLPGAPSALAPAGDVGLLRPKRPYVTPRALAKEELAAVVEAFRQGAASARAAGFDGMKIHGANG